MERFFLTNSDIDRVSEKLAGYLKDAGVDKKEIMRNRLVLEEVLINFQAKFGEEKEFLFSLGTVLSQIRCTVKVNGDACDPLNERSELETGILSSLLDYEGGTPNWNYHNGINAVFIVVRKKKKISFIAKIVAALVIGAALGLILKSTSAAPAAAAFAVDYLVPIANAFTGLLCVMAVLLTFFALPLGISGLGNADSFGQLSRKVILKMYAVMGVCVLIYFLIFLPRVNSFAGSIGGSVKSLFDIVIGFFPGGLVAPFLEFNSIQILIIGMMFGFAFLAMGEKGAKVIELFDACNLAAILTNNFLNAFIPAYVAISIFSSIIQADFNSLSSVPLIVMLTLAGFIALLIFYTAHVCLKFKMRPGHVARSFMPGTLVALSSGSFGAAFTTIINSVLNFGADANTATFMMNVGGIVFKPAHCITFMVSSVIMAGIFGVEVSVPWLIFAAILSIILTVAVPNVPGASASVYALLFTQLGLPNEALVMMISVNAFLEFVMVAVNMYCLQSEIIIQGYDPENEGK